MSVTKQTYINYVENGESHTRIIPKGTATLKDFCYPTRIESDGILNWSILGNIPITTITEIYFDESFSSEDVIPNNFLAGATSIVKLDITNLKPTIVGDYFLYRNKKLETLDISSLKNINTIGRRFMFSCKSIHDIDFSELINITHIYEYFMVGCISMESIDLSSMKQLMVIGDNFMILCAALDSIDLSGCNKLDVLGTCFAQYCTVLTKLYLPASIESIDNKFLYDCHFIKDLNISHLKLKRIHDDFMYRCMSVTSVTLPKHISRIGHNFMHDCTKLIKLDLSQCNSLISVGNGFLSYCNNITSVKFHKFSNIRFGYDFMYACNKINDIQYNPSDDFYNS